MDHETVLKRRRRNAIWVNRQKQIGSEAESNHRRPAARMFVAVPPGGDLDMGVGKQSVSSEDGRRSACDFLSNGESAGNFVAHNSI